ADPAKPADAADPADPAGTPHAADAAGPADVTPFGHDRFRHRAGTVSVGARDATKSACNPARDRFGARPCGDRFLR
ncbi:MAG TPA: hypothetical protein VKA76_03205, partial [Gammaproteobacteria bacterium]|nr:hypothetical protein [Gammaproteobacteria bacterium]